MSGRCRMLFSLPAFVLSVSFLELATFGAPPRPEKHPQVLNAQDQYNQQLKVAVEARQEVSRLRMQLSRLHTQAKLQKIRSQRGNSALGSAQKSDEQLKAEKTLASAKTALASLLDRLHQLYQNEQAIALRKEILNLMDELDSENSENNPDGRRVSQLTMSLRHCERKLEKLEALLFAHEQDYLAAKREVTDAQKQLSSMMKQTSASTSSSGEPSVSDEMLSAKEEIQRAVEEYAAANLAKNQAKKALEKQLQSAAIAYNKWVFAEAKKKKEAALKAGKKSCKSCKKR